LRRIIKSEFGVTPTELGQTKRLLLAKQLITETSLALIDVAYASGFQSVRRFNVAFKSCYALTPSAMRRSTNRGGESGTIQLSIPYRPPFAWDELLAFLTPRLTLGVEAIVGGSYIRSIQIDQCRGWFKVSKQAEAIKLVLVVSVELLPVLSQLLAHVRCLFDIYAQPTVIADQLEDDSRIGQLVKRRPGIRIPGAVDGFELIVRAVLGQQISVKAATTLAARFAERFGEPFATPTAEISRLTPTPQRVARATVFELTELGVLKSRAETILSIARACRDGGLPSSATEPQQAVEQLKEHPGIGEWTAQYVAMRLLHWPDAFPESDLGLLKAAHVSTPRELRKIAETWRPWRAYAAMYLWKSLSDAT
jgi:AraC family transcriptional regulator of adaptative response / DNA-3-methyladenine glycosylase II